MSEIQDEIITRLGVDPHLDIEAEILRRVQFLVDYLDSVPGARGFVLGVSGGQDSSLTGKLCQMASERQQAVGKPCELIAVRLPYGVQRDEDDAQLALRFIEPDRIVTIDIKPSVDALAKAVGDALSEPEQLGGLRGLTDFHRGNIKARIRMTAQYAIAGEHSLLVVGTDHAAEALTGFFTKSVTEPLM